MIHLFLIISLLFNASSTPLKAKKDKDYTVFIKQDNQIQMLKRGSFKLNRSSFSFDFRFSEPMGVYVNASFSPESYEAAKAGKDSKEIPGFHGDMVNFDKKNEDQELLVDPSAYSYYYFKDTTEHSFSGITPLKDKLKCERVISQIIDQNGNARALTKLTQKVYIVIVLKEKNKKGIEEEIKRSFFILDFS